MSLRLECKGGHPHAAHRRECWVHEVDRFVQIAVAVGQEDDLVYAAVDSAGLAWGLDTTTDEKWKQLPLHPSNQWDEHGDPLPKEGDR